jgi:transcriptional regulator with PAS, ATPase and Fis domain
MNEQIHIECSVLENIPQGTCIINADLDVVFWNKQMVTISGISKDEITDKKIYHHFPKFLDPKYKLRIDNGFNDRTPVVFSSFLSHDLFVLDSNKERSFYKITITFFIKDDKTLGIVTLEDRTELHLKINEYNRTKNELKNSIEEHAVNEKRLSLSLKSSDQGLMDWDIKNNLLFFINSMFFN